MTKSMKGILLKNGKRSHRRGSSVTFGELPNIKDEKMNASIVGLNYNKDGNNLFTRGEYDSALSKYKEALQVFVDSHGLESKYVAATLANIGNVFWKTGNVKNAIKYLEKSMEVHKSLPKNEMSEEAYIDMANTLHSLGIVYFLLRKDEKALQVFNKSLSIREKVFGYQSVDVARTYDAIGSIYLQKKKTLEAIKTFTEALAIKQAILASDHISIVLSMKNLASSYKNNQEYEKSLSLYQKVLSIQTKDLLSYSESEVEDSLLSISEILTSMSKSQGSKSPKIQQYNRVIEAYKNTNMKRNTNKAKRMKTVSNVMLVSSVEAAGAA